MRVPLAALVLVLASVPSFCAHPWSIDLGQGSAAASRQQVESHLRYHGKEISIHGDTEEKQQDTYRVRGHVLVTSEEVRLTADEASVDAESGDVIARGNVVFDDVTSHITTDEVHYNFRTKKGWFSNAAGYVHARGAPGARVLRTENPFYLSGQRVERLDEDTYEVVHGRLTSCPCAKEGWLLSVGRARVREGDKAVAHDAVFRFFGVPIFYFPFLVDSLAREPRQTGFLLPHIGNSTQKGYIVGEGFFWAINPSTDLMLGLEDYSKRGVAERGQFRIRPGPNADFTVDYFGLNDKYSASTLTLDRATQTYQKIRLNAPGESIRAVGKDDDIGGGFRAVAAVDYVNTMAFRLTWSTNYSEAVSSEALQTGFISKNWSTYSFNVSAERYEDFLSTQAVPGNAVIIRHLPSFQFGSEDRQLGDSPVYFSLQTSADAVGRTAPGLTLPLLEDRLDFHPQFLLRSKEFWNFHFTPMLGFRATRYGVSLTPNRGAEDRLLAEIGADLRPPSLEKVFSRTYHGHRFKHVVEPDVQYHLVRAHDSESVLDIVRFDALDIFTETNEIEYSLTNTLMARRDVPDTSPDVPQARDVISWRLSQKYYFDPTFGGALVPGQNNVFASTIDATGFAFAHGQRLSPIDSILRFAPSSSYDTEIRTDVNPGGTGGILDAGITSRVRHGPMGVALTDFFVNHSSYFGSTAATAGAPSSAQPLTAFNLLGAVATYGDPNHKGLSGAFGMHYNFQQKIFQHQVTQLSYNFGCFAVNIEYQYYNLGPLRRESQFRIALALANVGTFGNLRPRERLSLDSPIF